MSDRISQNLQESLVSLLCLDSEYGKIAAGIIDVELLEPPFDDIAQRAIDYHRQYKEAPGKAHVDDIFDHVLSDKDHKRHRLYTNVLDGILSLADDLNGPYILSRINDFMSAQNLKAAIIEAGTKIQNGAEGADTDARNILTQALKFRSEPLEVGTFLGDRKTVIGYLNNSASATYLLGIQPLDHRQIGPTLGEMLLFMAPKGRGKTWFCIHAGLACLLQGARVLHITLEMKNERIMPRYLQKMFAIAKRPDKFNNTIFERDKLERVTGFKIEELAPNLNFQDARINHKITQRMGDLGEKLNRLLVKSFPTDTLTVPQLEAYLDALELTAKFTPNVIILDYPDLMDVPGGPANLRQGLGKLYKELRGLCQRRNIAGIFPVQSNRQGESASLITAEMTGEDYSKTQTADMLLTYSQTKKEKELGLARLYVDKARNDEDKFSILIAQQYRTGQFITDCAYIPSGMPAMVKKALGEDDGD